MSTLERYLADCEGKRRRMRDRPSDEVLGEIRRLLRQLEEAKAERRTPSLPQPLGPEALDRH